MINMKSFYSRIINIYSLLSKNNLSINNCFKNVISIRKYPGSSRPLDGVRILDMTRVLAGPYCSMILGDLGADVIKVERIGIGDDTRAWGNPRLDKGTSAYYLSVNRNKRSIAIDFRSKEGANTLKLLAAECDVLLENYIPGTLHKYGLSYEHLRHDMPRLIYTSITGFGQTGPYCKRGGYDPMAAAIGGLMQVTGPKDGPPVRSGIALTDLSCGLYASTAILAALRHHDLHSGRGQHIDCNLLNTQIASLTHIASNYLNCDQEAKRYGTGHPSVSPLEAYLTKDDRHLMIGAGNDAIFRELCKFLDLPAALSDERFTTNDSRVKYRDALEKILSRKFKEHTLDDWLVRLENAKFPFGPVNTIGEALTDKQVVYNDMIQDIEHPVEGKIRVSGPAVKYSDCETTLRRPPPTLGQHTDQILREILKLSDAEIQSLHDQKVVAS